MISVNDWRTPSAEGEIADKGKNLKYYSLGLAFENDG
jgi:hypothetical protein